MINCKNHRTMTWPTTWLDQSKCVENLVEKLNIELHIWLSLTYFHLYSLWCVYWVMWWMISLIYQLSKAAWIHQFFSPRFLLLDLLHRHICGEFNHAASLVSCFLLSLSSIWKICLNIIENCKWMLERTNLHHSL